MRRSVTIRDVAEAAGVGIASVSDVLNEKGHTRVAPATRERILAAAKRLQYRPSQAARSLRTGLSYQVGLAFPIFSDTPFDTFQHEALDGALRAVQDSGWSIVLLAYRDRRHELEILQDAVHRHSVDGVLLLTPYHNDPRIAALQGRLPFVMMGRCTDPTLPTVDNDNVQAAAEATRHLLRLGRRRIAFVHFPGDCTLTTDRLEGYHRALAEAGIPPNPEWMLGTADIGSGPGEQVVGRALDRLSSPPDAFLAMNDDIAAGVMRAVQRRGLRVPEDVAVVGFNDGALAALCHPPLTTVRTNAQQLGFLGTRALLGMIRGQMPDPLRQIVPTQLVIRKSCGGAGPTHEGEA